MSEDRTSILAKLSTLMAAHMTDETKLEIQHFFDTTLKPKISPGDYSERKNNSNCTSNLTICIRALDDDDLLAIYGILLCASSQ